MLLPYRARQNMLNHCFYVRSFCNRGYFFLELRHLASLRVWVVVVVSCRQAAAASTPLHGVSAHTTLREERHATSLPHSHLEYTEFLFSVFLASSLITMGRKGRHHKARSRNLMLGRQKLAK